MHIRGFWVYRACCCVCVCCCLYSHFSLHHIDSLQFSPAASRKQARCHCAKDHCNRVDFYTPITSPIIHIISSRQHGSLLATDKAGHSLLPSTSSYASSCTARTNVLLQQFVSPIANTDSQQFTSQPPHRVSRSLVFPSPNHQFHQQSKH